MYWLTVALLAFAFGTMQALIGGAKLVFSLPAYVVLGFAGYSAVVAAWRGRVRCVNERCITTALLLAGYVCARALFSPVPYLARTDFFMVLGALVVYLVTAVHLGEAKRRLALLWILFGFAGAHLLVGIVQFTAGHNYMLLPGFFRPDYGNRASGFYICPNHIAGLFEMLAMLALSICFWGRGRPWVRIVSAYAAAICLGGVAITGSRGGYLSVVAGALAFVGLTLWAIRKLRFEQSFLSAGVVVVTVAGLLGGVFFFTMKSRNLAARVDQVYDPTNMRVLLWRAAVQQFALQPIFGTGSGTYDFYGRHFRAAVVQNDPVHVHDDYLELLAEYGIVGAVFVGAFVGVHFASGIRGAARIIRCELGPSMYYKSNELALSLGALAALSALLAHSFLDFNLHIPANTLFVAFLFGILANPAQSFGEVRAGADNSSADGEAPAAAWLRYSPAVLGVLLACGAARFIPGEYYGERARVALRDGMYPEAVAYALRALSSDRKNPDVYFYLGEARRFLALQSTVPEERAADSEAAVSAYRGGLEAFPYDLRLQLKLGAGLDVIGRFDEAEPIFRKAMEFDPNFGNVYAYYGLHMHLQSRFDEAERLYRKAEELQENEISPQGLKELDQDRKAAKEADVFSDFVSKRREVPADAELAKPAPNQK